MNFEDALKKVRRNIYLHGNEWRTAVVCPNAQRTNLAFDEARFLIDASSLGLQMARAITHTIMTERNAVIRFFTVEDGLDVYKLSGTEWSHILILCGDYPSGAMDYLRAMLRSQYIPADKLIWQDNVEI